MFGEVVEGFDVIDRISEAICDDEHRPYQDIRYLQTVFDEVEFGVLDKTNEAIDL